MARATMTLLRILTSVSAAADRPASNGNQIISSTRPSCWTRISMVDVINVAANHQMFMTLTSAWDVEPLTYTQQTKNRNLSHPLGHLGVTYALHL